MFLESWMDLFGIIQAILNEGKCLIWSLSLHIVSPLVFFLFLKAVSTSLTESTLKNVPQVVNVRELKSSALTPAVSAVIG